MVEPASYDDVLDYVSGSILSCPEDDVFDNIFDWIQNSTQQVIDNVVAWINYAVGQITSTVSSLVRAVISPVSSFVSLIYTYVIQAWSYILSVYSLVSSWIGSAYSTVYSAVSSGIATVSGWIHAGTSSVISWITTSVREVWGWISTSASTVTATIRAWFTEQLSSMGGLLSAWGDNITSWLAQLGADLSGIVPNLSGQLGTWFEYLTAWIGENVVSPVDTWWDQFMGRLLDFGSWVTTLMDTVWDWLQEDVPGHSPRKQWIWDDIGGFFYYWFGWYAGEVAKNPPRAAMRVLTEGLGFVGDMFGEVMGVFMEALEGYVEGLGPTNPDIAEGHSKALTSVGMTALGGLAGMTLASSWMKPLGGAGMGQIAAMIYDMTNYKVITGAFIGALTGAAMKIPLMYHFNELFRPNIVDAGTFLELMSRKAWINPEPLRNPDLTASINAITKGDGRAYELKWLGYRGYPDIYHGLFKELANAPLRYFPLAGIARTGFFERVWFTEALQRSGYSITAVDALMIMYEKMRDEALQGAMSGAAVSRFKEGFTTEEQFGREMEMLGYSEQQFLKYLAAAKIDYSTDYLRDLLAAYKQAATKGHISLDEYRENLLGLGVVPERVQAYVIKMRAVLRPKEKLTVIAPPTPAFETDYGKVQVDTIRRERRKNIITRDQELSQLLGLGMETDYATAIANNDDIRLAEKIAED